VNWDVTDAFLNAKDQGNVIFITANNLAIMDRNVLIPVRCEQTWQQSLEGAVFALSL
jgi:hypothetical protein